MINQEVTGIEYNKINQSILKLTEAMASASSDNSFKSSAIDSIGDSIEKYSWNIHIPNRSIK